MNTVFSSSVYAALVGSSLGLFTAVGHMFYTQVSGKKERGSTLKLIFSNLNFHCQRKIPTSGCWEDLWWKKVFLILVCNDTINLEIVKTRGFKRPPPLTKKNTSWCCADSGKKNVFLILACDDTIFKTRRFCFFLSGIVKTHNFGPSPRKNKFNPRQKINI